MERNLDQEWVELMIQAKQIGMPTEEIRRFLQQRSLVEVSLLENKNEVTSVSTPSTLT
ncbi:anti-repressor SinI family protein [Pseudoneobacillus sp. C159]